MPPNTKYESALRAAPEQLLFEKDLPVSAEGAVSFDITANIVVLQRLVWKRVAGRSRTY